MASFAVGITVAEQYIYDHTLPITNIRNKVLTPFVTTTDRRFRYSVTYNKRTDCKSRSGNYNIAGKTLDGDEFNMKPFRLRTEGSWAVGQNQSASPTIHVPEAVPPGVYNIWWNWCYECRSAKNMLCMTAEPMTFRVKP